MSDSSLKKGRFTKFSNRIGLYSNQTGNYIANTPEVVLNFPFKDTVLEGGMTKEDSGRDERFLHLEIDNKDIDTLEDPKVFTNFRYIDKNGETTLNSGSDIEFFDDEDELKQNLLIKGNNLLALYSLREKFSGKVKFIYIDPPYNTGNDGFRYNDSFNHSSWLITFIKNRLEVAQSLLTSDGLIFVSCDDNEHAYLKVLMDEIFGDKNFLTSIVWHNNKKGRQMDHFIKNSYENILCYARDIENITINDKKQDIDVSKYEHDEISAYKKDYPLHNGTADFHINNRPNLAYSIYYNPNTGDAKPIDEKTGTPGSYVIGEPSDEGVQLLKAGYVRIKPKYNSTYNNQRVWRWGQEKFLKEYKTELLFIEEKDGWYIYQKKRFSDGMHTLKYTNYIDVDGGRGKKELQALFGKAVFNNPKPEHLIKTLLEMATVKNDLVLDFCLGSGTTASVAHKMNRRWIGVEQMDYIETVSKKRLEKVIDGEQGGISKDVNWQGGGSFVYMELKKYNQDFLDRLMEVTSIPDVEAVYEDMQKNAFLKFFFDKKEFEKDENFRSKTWEERRDMLVEILDENQLYLNLQDMRDSKHKVSNDEMVLTDRFYGVNEDAES